MTKLFKIRCSQCGKPCTFKAHEVLRVIADFIESTNNVMEGQCDPCTEEFVKNSDKKNILDHDISEIK